MIVCTHEFDCLTIDKEYSLRILVTAFVVSALLLVAACGNSTSGPSSSENWFPLTVGNWWLYEVDGTEISEVDTLTFSGTVIKRITSLQDHEDGFQVYELLSISNITTAYPDTALTRTDTSSVYLQQTAEELNKYSSITSSEYFVTMIKFPVTLGETWPSPDSFPGGFEVTGFDEFIYVPAGGFSNCAVISEAFFPQFVLERSYHEGTGMIKFHVSSPYYSGTQSLQSYNVQ